MYAEDIFKPRNSILRDCKFLYILLAALCLSALIAMGVYFGVTESTPSKTNPGGSASTITIPVNPTNGQNQGSASPTSSNSGSIQSAAPTVSPNGQSSASPNGQTFNTGSTLSSNGQSQSTISPNGQGQSSASTTSPNGQIQSHYSSASRSYPYAAVTSDTNHCAAVGTDILARQGGSAVDAIIAVATCSCLYNAHLCGPGGGHFATIYERPRNSTVKEIMTLTARERAPLAATEDMFVNKPGASTFGGLAVGVPGEISGFYQAWKRYGRIPWKDLFSPSIKICEEGLRVERELASSIQLVAAYIKNDTNLSELYMHPNGSLLVEGDLIVNIKLAQTLRRISDDSESFYKGSLADDIIADLSEYGSIITKQDLISYFEEAVNFTFKPPVKISLKNGNYDIYSVPPPSSGVVLEYILNILDGYGLTSDDIGTVPKKALTYHRMVEAFKFAYAKRSALGDNLFVNVSELVQKMTSGDYAESIRHKITDDVTHDVLYYEPLFEYKPDAGTSHLNVLTQEGGAVALTTTINTRFASKIRGKRTGIIFNNEMDDFSTPGTVNAWGVPASPSNFIKPKKMPQSSMAPMIVLKNSSYPVYLSGGAGGTRITTLISFIAVNTLWLGVDLKEATDQGRIHHQLLPDYVEHEPWLSQEIVQLLKSRGHNTSALSDYNSVAASIRNNCTEEEWSRAGSSGLTCITAVQDGRRGGVPGGF